MGKLYQVKRNFIKKWGAYQKQIGKPNKDVIWVFGMQKSGTSAIAGLLAHRSGKTVTIDTPELWTPHLEKLKSGQLSLKNHIYKNPYDFSKDIIKEPNATFLFDELKGIFKLKKYVVIIRNPFDTIRSILNRLGLPGDQSSININDVNPNWRGIFNNNGNNYISDLCELWNEAYSNEDMINSKSCILVKYEDFVEDKTSFIDDLCRKLNLPLKYNIELIQDKNFQPKGDKNVDLANFFGYNYNIIKDNCIYNTKQTNLF